MNCGKWLLEFVPESLLVVIFNVRAFFRYNTIASKMAERPISVKSALVVAPHPDDETFGCGGLIALKLAAGAAVRVVLLTDGEAVESGYGEKYECVVNSRRNEFINACKELGLDCNSSLVWLHLPDGKLPHPGQPGFGEASKLLGDEIMDFAPEEIYCPHWQDMNRDHVAAARMTVVARQMVTQKCSVFYYPVWIWHLSSMGLRKRLNLRDAWQLDISRVLAVKHRALEAYLEAPVSASGKPYCGVLPWSLSWSIRRPRELYFSAAEMDFNPDDLPQI
jgi:N-acetylglucosamine malate deacetylase 1